MKNLKLITGTFLLIGLMISCSSVRVTDTWKDSKNFNINDKTILVVSKTDEETTRVRFEKDLVNVLNENGFTSVESHVKFPFSNPTEQIKKEDIHQIIKDLKMNGIDVVIMSRLIESKEYTKTITTNDSFHYNSLPYRYRRYHRFVDYYDYFYGPYYSSSNVNSTEIKGMKYIVETVVYDLTKSVEEQLVSVITSEVDNPRTLGTTSTDFSNRIVKKLTIR